jgi:hypothetical protein
VCRNYCEGNHNQICNSHCYGNNNPVCNSYYVGPNNPKCVSNCQASAALVAMATPYGAASRSTLLARISLAANGTLYERFELNGGSR